MSDTIDCSPAITLHGKNEQKDNFGLITHLKIGSTKIKPGSKLHNPLTEKSEEIVAVLRRYSWPLGQQEPMMFEGWVPESVAQQIDTLKNNQNELQDSSAEITFSVVRYDPTPKVGYFEARMGKEVQCVIPLQPGDHKLALNVDVNPRDGYCAFAMTISPQPKKKGDIHIANFKGHTRVTPFGHEQ